MERKLEIVRSLLRMLFNLLFTLMLAHTFCAVYVDKQFGPQYIGEIVAFYIVSYAVTTIIKNMPAVISVHIMIIGAAVALPNLIEIRVLLATIAVVLFVSTIVNINKPVQTRKTGFPIAQLVAVFLMNLYAYYIGNEMLIRSCYILPVVMLFLFLVSVYLDGLQTYIDRTSSITGIPVKRVVFTNSMFVVGILFALLVAIVIINLFGVDGNSLPIWKGLASAALLILFGIIYLMGSFINAFTENGKEGAVYSAAKQQIQEEGTNRLGQILEMLIIVALIAVILYVIYKLIRMLGRRLLLKKQHIGDLIERADEYVEVAEKRETYSMKSEPSTAESKIRKLYRNRILKHKNMIDINDYKTVRDYEMLMKREELGDIKALSDLYASVRYGEVKADKKLVKEMKDLAKK
ncbi:MAG: hypothetical protein PUB54_05455 [Lachnospiraceae bacterium]|nr:hypothetical protein [Lachnospiraceae bacterium]